nr:amino acid racemase [Siphonobacter sp. SORGH_AS_0500]
MIGGMSWESSALYYQIINRTVKEYLGNLHSCSCLLYSVDFAQIEKLQHVGDWQSLSELMIEAAQRLEKGGADLLILCTNTMHKVADQLQEATQVPFLHIADPTAEAIVAAGLSRVALLGTRFTMMESFYKGRLKDKYNLQVLIPDPLDIDTVHRVIYEELVQGIVQEKSRLEYLAIIDNFISKELNALF